MFTHMPVGTLVEDILENSHGLNSEPLRKKVWRLLNTEAVLMAGEASWAHLRSDTDLDMTTVSDESGLYLPSDVLGIDRVWDETNDIEFIHRDQSEIDAAEYGYRYYTYAPSADAAVDAKDLNIEQGAATFTSAALSAWVAAGNTATNLYCKFGEEFGMYKITNNASPFAITPTYHGPTISGNARIQVRPAETQKLVIIDASENVLQDRTVAVYYWKLPRPFYRNEDNVPFANPDALALRVLRKMAEAKPFRPVSQNEIDNAMAKAMRQNPTFRRKGRPRDKHNKMFSFAFTTSNNLFSNRSTR